MEADLPRQWVVTYTKHVNKKRKVYQDGALVLHPASGHLVLLDEAGVTVECRFLRAGEDVSSGASLAFQRHLVDVGEPERHPTCYSGSGSGSGSGAATSNSRAVHRGGARARPSAVNSRAPRAFVNPTTKGGGCMDEAAGPSGAEGAGFQEWTALYTAHLTQKAKKYHDGVVRLVQVGSHAKQIVLLDEEGEVLGIRYLKLGESVESGKKCHLPNYLIEICEAKSEKKGVEPTCTEQPMAQTRQRSGENKSNKMGSGPMSKSLKFIRPKILHDLEESKSENTSGSSKPKATDVEVVASGISGNIMGLTDSGFQEWNALYTTQLTQKAKKYRDGVIKLMQIGSHAKQIVLLDEEGGVLGSKYLKSGESVECGMKCQLPNYLIEICEIRKQKNDVEFKHSSEEASSHTRPKSGENTTDRTDDKNKSPKFVSPLKFNHIQKGKPGFTVGYRRTDHGKSTFSNMDDPHKLHDLQDVKSGCSASFIRRDVEKSTFGNMDDSLRTASQILSIMKPPSEIKYSQSIPASQAHSSASFGNSGLSHCAMQLRTSVQSCLNLETLQTKSSVSSHHQNELSGNAHPTYDHQTIILKQASKLTVHSSGNHQTGSSNGLHVIEE
ncbi:hypothetical protein GUJ93_ZPchr0002g25511 [Zizania palustris]|uniref:5'-3' DNA helicase ZGRF1-like N-terminal domain-containing protein n=1 Tax=Zizania palustris TaxID=103762 RepID=A0A8J5RU94_ZIZPA|nr:hypothetical protein GUJ93_ZPchr0002g25511 [Zizania palustris]